MIEDLKPGDVVLMKMRCVRFSRNTISFSTGYDANEGAPYHINNVELAIEDAKQCIVGVQKAPGANGNRFYEGLGANPPIVTAKHIPTREEKP